MAHRWKIITADDVRIGCIARASQHRLSISALANLVIMEAYARSPRRPDGREREAPDQQTRVTRAAEWLLGNMAALPIGEREPLIEAFHEVLNDYSPDAEFFIDLLFGDGAPPCGNPALYLVTSKDRPVESGDRMEVDYSDTFYPIPMEVCMALFSWLAQPEAHEPGVFPQRLVVRDPAGIWEQFVSYLRSRSAR